MSDATGWFCYFVVGVGCYLLGSFPTGVVFSKRKYGIDVREMGSGNIGATNVTRVFGWYAGVLVFIVDFLKGILPLWALKLAFPDEPWFLAIGGIGLVAGHCYSLFLKMRGGKGVATSLGCLCVAAPWAALIAALLYVGLLLTVRISAVGSLGGIAGILLYTALAQPPTETVVLILGISFLVVIRHRRNIQRLMERKK